MNYEETIQYLYAALPVFHRIGKAAYKANMDNAIILDNHFNNPHTNYKTIHVAGTNGKGSVSHILASVLQTAGYKTGLYTSPHLFNFRERIRINGNMISEQLVIDFVAENRQLIEQLKPSFFEITSAMAFYLFAKENVDIAVIETGLGGRLDSTNIISPEISVITNIGLDHTEFLGNTLADIAKEKAGIIKPHTPVVIGEKHAETTNVLKQIAESRNAPLYFAEECFEIVSAKKREGKQIFDINHLNKLPSENMTISIDLEGNYQQKNVITAISALAILKKNLAISSNAIGEGLSNTALNTNLQGRWQILKTQPLVIADTGHNAHGLAYTMKQLEETNHENMYIVFGVAEDKDIDSIVPFLPKTAYYYFTNAAISRAMKAEQLAQICVAAGLKGEIVNSVKEAVKKAIDKATANDVVFIGGSTFVVAEI